MRSAFGIYDIETDGLSPKTCRLACAVVLFLPAGRLRIYGPRDCRALVNDLTGVGVRIGHNSLTFDDPIIARSAHRALGPRCWDLLDQIRKVNNNQHNGWGLEAIGKAMCPQLGAKQIEGKEIPDLVSKGRWHAVIDHCIHDVQTLEAIVRGVVRGHGMVSNGSARLRLNIAALNGFLDNNEGSRHGRYGRQDGPRPVSAS
ncbi:MAG: hypothetical protein MI923_16075 [Phycisphaerales bacterium]|nr:hypothetical protein [Phycisphaerales bacterium]